MTVSGLDPGTTYYFAIKTSDEVPNESDISNSTSETTSTTGNEADYLLVDISSVALDPGDNKSVTGITIENSGGSDITLDRVTVSWTGGAIGNNFQEISTDSTVLWTGNVTTGTDVDITDFTLISGAGAYSVDYLAFKKDMTGTTIEITFTMSDASTKTVSNILP